MPKPHFPSRGGAHPPAWSAPRPTEATPPADNASEGREKRELEAEIRRLRQELQRAQKSNAAPGERSSVSSTSMVWAAIAICGAALLFAVFAVLRHG